MKRPGGRRSTTFRRSTISRAGRPRRTPRRSSLRGRGLGRALTRALADEARHRGFTEVWLRVVPDNTAARRAYEAAGFVRATDEQEAAFNAGQPRAYAWFRDAPER